jgi:hypothetical protein
MITLRNVFIVASSVLSFEMMSMFPGLPAVLGHGYDFIAELPSQNRQ